MAKFSSAPTMRIQSTGFIRTTDQIIPTFEGGRGYQREAESALFLLAVTNMVSEDTFYESGADRDKRFVDLVHEVTRGNPAFIAGGTEEHPMGLIAFLRDVANMRSASTVMAAEYVRAGGPNGRRVVNMALQRPDEPGEILGYWMSHYGKAIPAAVKRGVADAIERMINERQAIKYDGQSKGIRLGDVIELVHPKPRNSDQADLFKYLLDKRHDRDAPRIGENLDMVRLDQKLLALPANQRRKVFKDGLCEQAGWSWERLGGWLPGGMDAEAWEGIIPSMGYMALLRNLRNFDQKGVSDAAADRVIQRLTDPEQVANSRQFPYRFLSAYKAAEGSLRWSRALDKALDLSCSNIPVFSGRTEIVLDLSASMTNPVSEKTKMERWEVGAIFAAALAKRCGVENVDFILFGTYSKRFEIVKTDSVLTIVKKIKAGGNHDVGHGTNTWAAINGNYTGQDRVVVFTDEQTTDSDGYGSTGRRNPKIPNLHCFNLAGYAPAMMPSGAGKFTYGGFTDATFRLMPLLETSKGANWPF